MARLLITGGSGLIGQKLVRNFRDAGHQVVSMGFSARTAANDTIIADLSEWQAAWATHFRGVDCVISLAACARPDAGWAEVQRVNIDLCCNVYEAAAQAMVPRVVFASSNWVMAGHRADDGLLTSDTVPAPVNAYGASKLAGERIGRMYNVARGMSVICLRIGFNQARDDNQPGDHMSGGLWGQRMWLSDRDMCHGFERAAFAPDDVGFAVLNLTSRNEGSRWDLAEAERLIGYRPRDGYAPVETPELIYREDWAREQLATLKTLQDDYIGSRL